MNVVAIVPAAGSGVRMQHADKKPYIAVEGRTILGHTLGALNRCRVVDAIIIAVSPGDEQVCREQVLDVLELRAEVRIVAGGQRRQDSVANALAVLPEACDVVVIHDGARPFVSSEILHSTIVAARTHGAATAAVPVKDTIMRCCEADPAAPEVLPRQELYAIQTPQAFRRDIIVDAHIHARGAAAQATDDASLVRLMDLPVAIVPGSYDNIKITTAGDLQHAVAILRAAR